jgi:signal transduction histidine kinase/CheY-like chemotaxis protein
LPGSFRILLHSPRDLAVLRNPSWWTTAHTFYLLGGAVAITMVVLSWVFILRKRVRHQTEVIRHQLQQTAELKEIAEAASRAKSEFLANMSHEIRTPMNGVMGMIELARNVGPSPEQTECLALASSSATALLTVINDILDFSKIEAGKLQLDAIDFRLRDCLEETLAAFALQASQKDIELVCDLSADIPAIVCGDPARLRQVLTNLLGNALKFTEKGEVCLMVARCSESGDDATLCFSVADTGIGIKPELQNLIFDAFSQADSSTSRKYGGTGLGLTICSRLVNLMGGRMWVESTPGEGSRFHFTARMAAAAAASEAPALELDALRNVPALVVDDNSTSRRIVSETLRRWGLTVAVAGSGAAALAALAEAVRGGTPFRLIVADAIMPELDGFTLAKRVKEQPGLTCPVVMMLSTCGDKGDSPQQRDAAVDIRLAKPVREAALRKAVIEALAQGAGGETRAVEEESSAGIGEEPQSSQWRILLVEDNPVNQFLAKKILQNRGHVVTIANNGLEALHLIDRDPFDVALMDVQMPVMDGFEATAALRKREARSGTHLPVIALTAHAMKGDKERCLLAGMDGYAVKPLTAKSLLAAIAEVLPESGGASAQPTPAVASTG